MPRLVVTAEVEDVAKWEEGFRTHGDLFRSLVTCPMTLKPVLTGSAPHS